MNLGRAPKWILQAHSSDQVAQLLADPRSTPAWGRISIAMVCGLTMVIASTWTATIEPDEHSSIGPTQLPGTWRAPPKDIELMPQHQDFGLQPLSRLEAVAQNADTEEDGCNHAAIMFCESNGRSFRKRQAWSVGSRKVSLN
jgi:hypothetical protein